MKQRFYYRAQQYGYAVFMGNEAMQEISGGLFIMDVRSEQAAKDIVREYTNLFNLMRDAEDATITESI